MTFIAIFRVWFFCSVLMLTMQLGLLIRPTNNRFLSVILGFPRLDMVFVPSQNAAYKIRINND